LDSTPVGFIPTQLERFSLNDPLGNSSAAESPFGGIKQSGYGKESGKDVAVNEYLITKTGTFTLEEQS
jgi:acyl-CoA reductase-like NAD-dependent aldehyde dehydrogenase